jgi:uncharacterized protein (DUF2252 family)
VVEKLILKQEQDRQKELIPVRRERMSASPFSFFRGSAAIQAYDLAASPGTSFRVQACGDAHLSNFGLFASPERRLIFDINDFDETLPAPFEVDVKRLFASLEICGRQKGLSKEQRAAIVYDAAALYRKSMADFSEMGNIEVWYEHLDLENLMEQRADSLSAEQKKQIKAIAQKALSKNSQRAVMKFTETVNGKLRIKSNPPLIVPTRELFGEDKSRFDFHHSIREAINIYKESLPPERQVLIDQYEPAEMAHKVVGVGSVGRKAWILIFMGRENGDPLVMQIKEAGPSVLEAYYGASIYTKCGQRVVQGQRAIQNSGDILLGWVSLKNKSGINNDYYVRQLWDNKGSYDILQLTLENYNSHSLLCARTLAHAHAKTGDRHAIASYLGKSEVFEDAMVKYASAYADQNEADYDMFLKFCSREA